MEPILQVIISLYGHLVVLIIYDFLYRIQGPFFATPIMFGWVMKHLYRVKYLQVSYRIQGPFFATPIIFGWVLKHLYRVRIVIKDSLFQELIDYFFSYQFLQGLVGWVKPTQGQPPVFLFSKRKIRMGQPELGSTPDYYNV